MSDIGGAGSPWDLELRFMVSGARRLRARGSVDAADRLEHAAERLWRLRSGDSPTSPPTDEPAGARRLVEAAETDAAAGAR